MAQSIDPVLARLLSNNAQWVADVTEKDPDFFKRTAGKQEPKVLWIGCSDSRVPASVVTMSIPGDIFVHRNIANQFLLEDDNALSVLAYAVEHLGVSRIIVVGHTGCGGVHAAYEAAHKPFPPLPPHTPIDRWLAPLTALAKATGVSEAELVAVNIRAQVKNVTNSETIQEAWAKGQNVSVYGWVYDLETGLLRDLGVPASRNVVLPA